MSTWASRAMKGERFASSGTPTKQLEEAIFRSVNSDMVDIFGDRHGARVEFDNYPTCSYDSRSIDANSSEVRDAIVRFLTLVASNLSVMGLRDFLINESQSGDRKVMSLSYEHQNEQEMKDIAIYTLRDIGSVYNGDTAAFVNGRANSKMLDIRVSSGSSELMGSLATSMEKELRRSGIDLPVANGEASVSMSIPPGVDADLAYSAVYDAIVNFTHSKKGELREAGYRNGQWEHSKEGGSIKLKYKFTKDGREDLDIDNGIIVERFTEVLATRKFDEIDALFNEMGKNKRMEHAALFAREAGESMNREAMSLPGVGSIDIDVVSSEYMQEHHGLVRDDVNYPQWTIATLTRNTTAPWAGELIYKRRGDVSQGLTRESVYGIQMNGANNLFGDGNPLKDAISRKRKMLDYACRPAPSSDNSRRLTIDRSEVVPRLMYDALGQMLTNKRYKTYIEALTPYMTEDHWNHMGQRISRNIINFVVDDAQWAAIDRINQMTDGKYYEEIGVAADKVLVGYADDLDDLCPTFLARYEEFVNIQTAERERVDWESLDEEETEEQEEETNEEILREFRDKVYQIAIDKGYMNHLPSDIDCGDSEIEEYEVTEGWETTFNNAIGNELEMNDLMDNNIDEVSRLGGEVLMGVINAAPHMAVEIWRRVDDYEFSNYSEMLSSAVIAEFISEGYGSEIMMLMMPEDDDGEGSYGHLFSDFDADDLWEMIAERASDQVPDIIEERDDEANTFTQVPEYPVFKFLENGGRPEKIMQTRNPYAIRHMRKFLSPTDVATYVDPLVDEYSEINMEHAPVKSPPKSYDQPELFEDEEMGVRATWFGKFIKESAGLMRSVSFWIDDEGKVRDVRGMTHGQYIVNMLREKYGVPEEFADTPPERKNFPDMTDMEWSIVSGSPEAYERYMEYDLAIKGWDWIRVAGNQIMMRSDDRSTMKRLALGLERGLGENAYQMGYTVDIFTRGTVYMSYWDIDSGEVPVQPRWPGM